MEKLNTSREKLIKSDSKKKTAKTNESMKISYGGEVHSHAVYKIPIAHLLYNIRNGRFRAELLEKEQELKKKLNPSDEKDADEIQKLLLEQDENETKLLREDLMKHGQIDPGIITSDGAVINANRRMAILSQLHEETGEEKYSYLKVGILPQGVGALDLWRIEAGLQFGKDFRLKYGGINELLKLKEGLKQGLREQDISAALLGRYTKKQVEEKIKILDLIDSYLEFIGKKSEYHRIHDEGLLEKFISGYKAISNINGKENAAELIDIYNLLFLLIEKTEIRHLDVRELKDIVKNPAAYKELKRGYDSYSPRSISKEKLNENFETALEISNAKRDDNKPLMLLKKSLTNIQAVNLKSGILKTVEAKSVLKEINECLSKINKASNS